MNIPISEPPKVPDLRDDLPTSENPGQTLSNVQADKMVLDECSEADGKHALLNKIFCCLEKTELFGNYCKILISDSPQTQQDSQFYEKFQNVLKKIENRKSMRLDGMNFYYIINF